MSLDSSSVIRKSLDRPISFTGGKTRYLGGSTKTLGAQFAREDEGSKKIVLIVFKIFFYISSLSRFKKFYINSFNLAKYIQSIRINLAVTFSFSSSTKKSGSQNQSLQHQDEVFLSSPQIQSPLIPSRKVSQELLSLFERLFNQGRGETEKIDTLSSLEDLFNAQIENLSDTKSVSRSGYYFSSCFSYLCASSLYEEFQKEVGTLSDEYILTYIPKIQRLLDQCAMKYNLSSTRNKYVLEMQLFFTFSPFLLRCGLNETIAKNIFSIIKSMPNFLIMIPMDLLKKCIESCPELATDEHAIFSIIHHKVSENVKDTHEHKLVNIDRDLFALFLSTAKSNRNLRIIFFQLITHSIIVDSEFDKQLYHGLILKMIQVHPFLLTEIVPTSIAFQKDGRFIDLCLAVYKERPFKSYQFYLPTGDIQHYTSFAYSSGSTELDKSFYRRLAVKAHESGAALTKKQAKVIEEVFPRDSEEWRYFEEKGYFIKPIRFEPNFKTWDPSTIRDLIVSINRELMQEIRLGNLSEKRINFKLLIDCHDVKKAIKEVIKNGDITTESFLEGYREFVILYDQIIEKTSVFAFIRLMSQEFRDLIKQPHKLPSAELRKFILLSDRDIDCNSSYIEMEDIIRSYLEKNKSIISESRAKIGEIASAFFQNPFWQRHNYAHLAIHGTKIGTLQLIKKARKGEQCLRSAGDLLKRNIAPLVGQLSGSHTVSNLHHLSFSPPSYLMSDPRWERRKLIFSAASTYFQSIAYARNLVITFSSSKLQRFDLEETWEKCSVSKLTELLSSETQDSLFPINILRIRMTDPDADVKLAPYKQLIEEARTAQEKPLLVDDVYQALTQIIPLTLTAEEVVLAQDTTPIIFGVLNQYDMKPPPRDGEITLPTGLELGGHKDVPVVFTDLESVERVRKFCMKDGIEVESIDTLLFIDFLNSLNEFKIKKLPKDPLSEDNLQQVISQTVKLFAAPYYASPFPEKPIAPKEDSTTSKIAHQEELSRPLFKRNGGSYAEYAEGIMNAEVAPARETHGVMHMLRTALFSQIFMNIINPAASIKTRYLTAIAAAFHDSARQDEGIDRWDEMSAWALRSFLNAYAQAGVVRTDLVALSKHDIEMCYHALSSKDPKDGEDFVSDIQRAVHDADCMEIVRTLFDLSQFKKNKLTVFEAMEEVEFDQIVSEAYLFIFETETRQTKCSYEYESQDPYSDLVKYLTDNIDKYPSLNHYFFLQSPIDRSKIESQRAFCGVGCGAGSGK